MLDEGRCTCEQVARSELGPIENGERLARVVTSPNHFRKDGSLKPGTFPLTHILKSGLSLVRVDALQREEMKNISEAITGQKPGEELKGIIVCGTGSLRSISEEGSDQRALCVLDDPITDDNVLPDNPAHAIAISAVVQDETEVLRIQGLLLECFEGPIPIDDVYNCDVQVHLAGGGDLRE